MNRGHLRVFDWIIAFSIEKVSDGSPCRVQLRIAMGSPSTRERLKVPELGIFFLAHYSTQLFASSSLKTELNAPR